MNNEEKIKKILEQSDKGEIIMSNGITLFWEKNKAGGRSYYTDEIGNGILVWDTALVDMTTLLTAMTKECELNIINNYLNK